MKLTGLCGWSQVALGTFVCGSGPLLEPMLAFRGWFWNLFWLSWAVLGPLRAVLGRSWGLSRRSWLHLGGSWDLCWRSWAAVGLLLEVLGRYWGRCVRSWAALGIYLGGLGQLLGPIFAVCGRSWSLCGRSGARKSKDIATLKTCLFLKRERDVRLGRRSWGALRVYVDGLGLFLGPLLAVLGRTWDLCGRSWGRSVLL